MGNLTPTCTCCPETRRDKFSIIYDMFHVLPRLPTRAKPMRKKKKHDSEDSERSSQKSSNKEEEEDDDDEDDDHNRSTFWDWIIGIAGDEKAENYKRENQNDSYYSFEKRKVSKEVTQGKMGYLEQIRRSNENFVNKRQHQQSTKGTYQRFTDEIIDDEDDMKGVSEFDQSDGKSKSLETLDGNKEITKNYYQQNRSGD